MRSTYVLAQWPGALLTVARTSRFHRPRDSPRASGGRELSRTWSSRGRVGPVGAALPQAGADRSRETGVIKGYRALLDPKPLGVEVVCFAMRAAAEPEAERSGGLPERTCGIGPSVRECWTLFGRHRLHPKVRRPQPSAPSRPFVGDLTSLPNVRNVRYGAHARPDSRTSRLVPLDEVAPRTLPEARPGHSLRAASSHRPAPGSPPGAARSPACATGPTGPAAGATRRGFAREHPAVRVEHGLAGQLVRGQSAGCAAEARTSVVLARPSRSHAARTARERR